MRRIIILIVVAILAIFLLSKVFCKGKAATLKGKVTTSSRTKAKKGKTTGEIKPKNKEQTALEKQQAKKAERARKRELRKRQRAERLAKRLYGYGRYGTTRTGRRGAVGSRSGARTGRKSSVQLYKLSAIFTIEGKNFALIDGQNLTIGDVVQGGKIVDILNDRIIIDEFGRTRTVKIGESVLPSLITPGKTR
jgi:hypothetical protein